MKIEIIRPGPPSIDDAIQTSLDLLWPRVFMQWNSVFAPETYDKDKWQGRWEIWVELADVSHPDARNKLASGDEWNTDAQCWMRFLQTYQTADGKFAPADRGLVIGLEMADTWKNRRFYEDNIEDPYNRQEQRKFAAGRQQMADGSRYYRKLENPIVGPYTNSGWRWRLGV